MTNFDLSGAANRAASEMPGEWVLKSKLSPHLSMNDRKEAEDNPCVIFEYTKPAARYPSLRWCTKEDLTDAEMCAIMDAVGINEKMRAKALAMFPSNVVKFEPHPTTSAALDRDEEPAPRQMVAAHGYHGPQRG